jgi:hypothetical protein
MKCRPHMRVSAFLLISAVLGLVVLAPSPPAQAAPSIMQQLRKVTAPAGAANDHFGRAVSVSGDTLLIGAPFAGNPGAAYVFVRIGQEWVFQQKLIAPDGALDDFFGSAVALSGNTALIGSPDDDDNGVASGSAYVFARSGSVWSFQQKLKASDGAAIDQFGRALALYGGYAVVGAPTDDDAAPNSGSAYVFERTGATWTQTQKLHAPDPGAGDTFGDAIAVTYKKIIVASPMDDGLFADSGSAHVFTWSGIAYEFAQKITASDAAAGDEFGSSVAISSDTALVGAPGDAGHGAFTGSAYVFRHSGSNWTQSQKFTPLDGAAGDALGRSVALSEDTALVGAYGDSDGGWNSGSVYVLSRSGTSWSQTLRLVAPDAATADNFGERVALFGTTALVGAPQDDDNGSASGSVYVFTTQNPVYRFFKKKTGTHFYTPSEAEKAEVIAHLSSTYRYEGIAYPVNPDFNTQPLYRFFNKKNGSHFYTASAIERARVIANLSATYTYEGESYQVSTVYSLGKTPVYRFYNTKNGSHFYTTDEAEKANVIAKFSKTYTFEGAGFWVGQ